MKFTVISAVKFNGRVYAEGETIDTDEAGAAVLPAHCIEAQAKGKGKKEAQADAESGKSPE